MKEQEKTASGDNKVKNIVISLDKNAPHPYATLRSELEHARDISKGEVPNQKTQHFSRYEGVNEAEVASGYVYKKSQGKAQKTAIDTSISEPEQNLVSQTFMNDGNIQQNVVKSNIEQNFDNWYNDKSLESTVGDLINHEAFQAEGLLDDVLDVKVKHSVSDKLPTDTPFNETHTLGGYVTIENGEPVIYTNSSQAKELVEENLYHELQHARDLKNAYLNPNATVEERMAAYEAIQEVQDAVKAGDFETYKNTQWEQKADLSKEFLKTKKKEYYDRQTTSNNGRSSDNNEVSFSHEGNDTALNGNRELGQGTSPEESLGNPSTTIQGTTGQPQQLKLDFNSAEELPTKLASGELKEPTIQDIDNIITKGTELDVEISGTDWKALAKDADNIPTNIKDLLDMEEPETVQAFFSETDATLGVITRKQLFATKVISQLRDKLQNLGADASLGAKKNILDSINWLMEYKKQIGSGLGRGLNEQKFVNEALQTFGSKRFSELNRQSIYNFVDLLLQTAKDLNLNFTRGELLKNKTAIIQQIMTINPALVQSFVDAGGKVLQQVDDIITEIARGGDKAVLDKLKIYYDKHHSAFETQVEEIIHEHKQCLIIDAHSFSSSPLPYELHAQEFRPDICIGTDDYHTHRNIIEYFYKAFSELEYKVGINNPFCGTIVPLKYYQQNNNVHSVMLEINR